MRFLLFIVVLSMVGCSAPVTNESDSPKELSGPPGPPSALDTWLIMSSDLDNKFQLTGRPNIYVSGSKNTLDFTKCSFKTLKVSGNDNFILIPKGIEVIDTGSNNFVSTINPQ